MYTGDLQNLYIFIEELLKVFQQMVAHGTLIFLERFGVGYLLHVGKNQADAIVHRSV